MNELFVVCCLLLLLVAAAAAAARRLSSCCMDGQLVIVAFFSGCTLFSCPFSFGFGRKNIACIIRRQSYIRSRKKAVRCADTTTRTTIKAEDYFLFSPFLSPYILPDRGSVAFSVRLETERKQDQISDRTGSQAAAAAQQQPQANN